MTTSPVMGITEEILGEIERAGWKLVPVEPTPEMIDRSQYWHRCREPQVPPENFRGFYDALIASAPAAPVAVAPEPVAFYWDDGRKVHGPYFGRPSPDAIERADATPVFLYADPTAAERDALAQRCRELEAQRDAAAEAAGNTASANRKLLLERDQLRVRCAELYEASNQRDAAHVVTIQERDALRAEVEALREIREIASQCAANGGYLCSRDLIELREHLKK